MSSAAKKAWKSRKKTKKKTTKCKSSSFIVADNVDWLNNTMDPKQLKGLKYVDFDPFGCPADSMRAFFKQYPVRKKMFIGVTDGSKIYLGYKKGRKGMSWLKKTYGVQHLPTGTRDDQIHIMDKFLRELGRQHSFKVKPVNAGFGGMHAVYAGYEITPN